MAISLSYITPSLQGGETEFRKLTASRIDDPEQPVGARADMEETKAKAGDTRAVAAGHSAMESTAEAAAASAVAVKEAKQAEALLTAVWSMEAEWRSWAMRTLQEVNSPPSPLVVSKRTTWSFQRHNPKGER